MQRTALLTSRSRKRSVQAARTHTDLRVLHTQKGAKNHTN